MKLNTDIGRLVKEKKETYPTKKRMNLYFKVDRTTAPATAALYISFVVVVLVALSKVMILDPWLEVRGLEEQARQLEEENAALLLQLKDFSKVQEEYLRIARLMRCEYINAADFCRASDEDGVHLTAEGHRALARGVAGKIWEIFKEE